ILLCFSSLSHLFLTLSNAETASIVHHQLLALSEKGDLLDDLEFDVEIDAAIANPCLRCTYIALKAWKKAMYSDTHNFTGNWVSPDLGLFINVALLHINSNRLYNIIPQSISRLKLLHELDACNNRFVGLFPDVALRLLSLKHLDLRFNDFEGALLSALFDKELDAIFLNDNRFSSQMLDNFGNSKASVVVIDNNKIYGCLSNSIGKMTTTLNEFVLIKKLFSFR
ncbi:Pollen-specific leucine-rich repeat extensin-like protein, partial [Musa troglodytarum]